jgi:hypothetical protein
MVALPSLAHYEAVERGLGPSHHPDRREQRVTHFVILIEGSNASAGKDLGPFRASEAGTGFESLGPTPSS